MGNAFTELKIDKLKEWAQELAIDYKEKKVDIDAITLYKYRPSLDFKRVAVDRGYSKFPTEYAIVFDLMNYEWKNLTPEERFGAKDPYNDFINENTNFMDAGGSIVTSILGFGLDKVYKSTKRNNYKRDWVFLPRCKNIELTESVRVNEEFVVLYDRKVPAPPPSNNTTQLSILPKAEAEKTQEDIEKSKRFITETKLRYADNQGVNIKTPGRRWAYVTAGEGGLGFFKTTNDPVQWNHFLSMLQNTDHLFDLGKSRIGGKKEGAEQRRNPAYFKNTQNLKEIDTKLVLYFKTNYPHLVLPQNYTIVEKSGAGIRRFKFQIEDQNTWQVDNRSPGTRKKELKKLWNRYRKTKDIGLYERIFKITSDLVAEGILTTDDEMLEDLETIVEEKTDFGSSL